MAKRTSSGTEERPIAAEPVPEPSGDNAPKYEARTAEPERKAEPVNGIGTIDPFELPVTDSGAAVQSSNGEPKRRGRKPGGKNAPREKVSQDITINLEELIFGIHQGVAALCAADEMELDHEEAEKLATNFRRVGSLYNKQFNPATLIWLALIACLIEVYATRAVAIYKRLNVGGASVAHKAQVIDGSVQARPMAQEASASNRTQAPGPAMTPAQVWPSEPIED